MFIMLMAMRIVLSEHFFNPAELALAQTAADHDFSPLHLLLQIHFYGLINAEYFITSTQGELYASCSFSESHTG